MRHRPRDGPNLGRWSSLGEILMFWSAFGIGMAPYYINRSVVSGQLQFILYPAFFAGAALLFLVWPYTRSMRRNMALVVAALPPAIALASTTSYPSIVPSYKRLTNAGASFGAGFAGGAQQIKQTIEQVEGTTSFRQFGLYTDFGFIYAQHLHIPSYLPVNYPLDLTVIDPAIGSSTCAQLRQDRNEILITSERLDEPAMKLIADCGYVIAEELTVPGSGLTLLKRQ